MTAPSTHAPPSEAAVSAMIERLGFRPLAKAESAVMGERPLRWRPCVVGERRTLEEGPGTLSVVCYRSTGELPWHISIWERKPAQDGLPNFAYRCLHQCGLFDHLEDMERWLTKALEWGGV